MSCLSLKLNQTATSTPTATLTTTRLLLLLLLFCPALLGPANVSAERDFNINDSQVPLIEPKDVPAYKEDPYISELMRCQQSPNEILLALVLKEHDWSELSNAKRSHIQDKLAKFFAIPKEFVALDSVSKRDLKVMQRTALRKGGKGNKSIETINRRLGRASFVIGCNGNFFGMGEPIAKQIAHQIKDGTIGALAEENFGVWFIWRKDAKTRSQRRKRRQAEGSGVEEDDYDYEYDADDDETPEPVTEVPTKPTHAHRHHHGVSQELSENDAASVAPNIVDVVVTNSINDNNKNNNNAVDEEIEESVSKLESVISKTIENTKNIKELPVMSVAEVEDDVEEVVETAPQAVEVDKVVAEFNNELATATPSSHIEGGTTLATTATSAALSSSSTVKPSLLAKQEEEELEALNTYNSNNNNQDIEHTATSTQLTTSHSHNNNNNINNQHPTQEPSGDGKEQSHKSPSTSFSPYDANSSVSAIASTIQTVESESDPTLLSAFASASSPPASPPIFVSSTSTVSVIKSGSDNNNNNTITTTTTSTATMPTTATTTTQSQSQSPKDEDVNVNANEIDAASNNSILATAIANDLSSTTPTAVTPQTPLETSTAPTTTTTTFASTDYVEPRSENTPPIIKTRLQKLAVTSGKAFTFLVPEETFTDAEDLNNLRLELTDKDGHELKHSSWLQFNADKRELYGLPLDDTVSRWQYRLSATDSGNESVTEIVEISVQQHRGVRTVNHEINIAVKINEKHVHNIDWQLKLIHGIARTLEDGGSAALVVREIRQTPQDPQMATFVYFNETLPTSVCPEAELNEIVRRLDAQRLSDLVQPLLSIKSISGQLIGSCQKTEIAQPKPTAHMAKNLPPMPRNQVDRVNASVGQLLIYKVPHDTFYDPNDNELTLTLKSKEHKELSTRHWLQFDTKNEEFFGIPKGGDTGSEEYLLVAEDSGGLSATDALVVVVQHAPKKDFSVFFKAYLAIRHENFNADLQRKFVERIAQLHGDSNTNQIQVRSITTNHALDGTIVNFYNTSLVKSHNRCHEKEVAATRNVYLSGSDMTLRESVKKLLGPELNFTNMTVVPVGACHENMDINQREYIPTRTEEPSLKSKFSEDFMATILLPAVIIIVMILVASLIACCLHRRRNKSGKMELGDEEERKSFRTKGIPVIFQDEFDEKPEIGNKSPVILKDEKPPLLAPPYNTSSMNADNDVDEYVPPPAVVVGGREVRGKSPATPSYRKPPPYVSP